MIVKNYFNKKISTSSAILIVIFLSVLVGVTAWQDYVESNSQRIGTSEIKISRKQGGLPLNKLRNAEYGTCYESSVGKAKFTDGSFVKPLPDTQSATGNWSIIIIEDKIAFGDLNNDGQEDDVLVLNSSGGGTGSFYEIIAVINKDGEPIYFDCARLGDRVKINSVEIRSGKIIIDLITHDLEDPMCCPTINKTLIYQISGKNLVEI